MTTKLFSCNECMGADCPGALKRRSLSDLEAHMATEHVGYFHLECPIHGCGLRETDLCSLLNHLRRAHHSSACNPVASVYCRFDAQLQGEQDRLVLASVASFLGKIRSSKGKPLALVEKQTPNPKSCGGLDGAVIGPSLVSGSCETVSAVPTPLSDTTLVEANKSGERVPQAKSLPHDLEPQVCRMCKPAKALITPELFDSHIYSTHLGQWPYECTVCRKVFVDGDEELVVAHDHSGVLYKDFSKQINFYRQQCFGRHANDTVLRSRSVVQPVSRLATLDQTNRSNIGPVVHTPGRYLKQTGEKLVILRNFPPTKRAAYSWADSPDEQVPLDLLNNASLLMQHFCWLCKQSGHFWKYRDLHIFETHLKRFPFTCSQCPGTSFGSRDLARAHAVLMRRAGRKHVIVDCSGDLQARLIQFRMDCFHLYPPGVLERSVMIRATAK